MPTASLPSPACRWDPGWRHTRLAGKGSGCRVLTCIALGALSGVSAWTSTGALCGCLGEGLGAAQRTGLTFQRASGMVVLLRHLW